MVRKTVHFSGQVQGVGFRYTTRSIANNHAVTGFVRNLANGQVELVVEGDRDEVDAMIESVRERMQQYIREDRVGFSAASGEFDAFEIRR